MRYKIKDTISYREVEGQILLVSPIDNELYTLNGVGKLVWLYLVDGLPSQDLTREIASMYAIDFKQAQDDVSAFIAMLEKHQFITPENQ